MARFQVGSRVTYVGTAYEGSGEVVEQGYNDRRVSWDDGTHSWERLENLIEENLAVDHSSFEQSVRRHTDRIASVLVEKNKQYANSALDPIRVFSKADRTEQLRVRADDKLSRIRNGDTSEDALTDLAGYIILMKIAEESA